MDLSTKALTDDEGRSLYGSCSHCRRRVDNHDPIHRVTPIMEGGRGVECVLRGDISAYEAMPLGPRRSPLTDLTWTCSVCSATFIEQAMFKSHALLHRDDLRPMSDIRPAVAKAIADLDAEHIKDGCVLCWPHSGGWPCVTRQVADDLRAALEEGA